MKSSALCRFVEPPVLQDYRPRDCLEHSASIAKPFSAHLGENTVSEVGRSMLLPRHWHCEASFLLIMLSLERLMEAEVTGCAPSSGRGVNV